MGTGAGDPGKSHPSGCSAAAPTGDADAMGVAAEAAISGAGIVGWESASRGATSVDIAGDAIGIAAGAGGAACFLPDNATTAPPMAITATPTLAIQAARERLAGSPAIKSSSASPWSSA
jgi:hypothetical protein